MTDEELKAIEERTAKALDLAWRAIVRVRAGEPDGGALARAHAALDATMVQRDVPRLLEEVRRLRAELVSHCVAEQLSSGSQTGCDHAAGHCEMFALTRPK